MGYVGYVPSGSAQIASSLANIGSGIAHAINPNMDLQTHMRAAMALHPELAQALSDRAYNSDDPKFLQKMGLGGKIEEMIRGVPPSPAAVTLGKARHQAGDSMDALSSWAQKNLPEGSPERQAFFGMIGLPTEEQAADAATKASVTRAVAPGLIAGAQLNTQENQEKIARNQRLSPILNNPQNLLKSTQAAGTYLYSGDEKDLAGVDPGIVADLAQHPGTQGLVNMAFQAAAKGDINQTKLDAAHMRMQAALERGNTKFSAETQAALDDKKAGVPGSLATLTKYNADPAIAQRAADLAAGKVQAQTPEDNELSEIAKYKIANSKASLAGGKDEQAAKIQGAKDMDAIGKEISSPKFDSNDADNSAVRFNEAAQRAGSDLRATVNHPKFLGRSTVAIKDAKGNDLTPSNVGSHLSLDTDAIVKEYQNANAAGKTAFMNKLSKKDPATRAAVMSAIQAAGTTK